MKILVAEDDAVSRKVLERYLTNWGYEAITAADGREAWAAFSKAPEEIPIIITDWMMPEMDGLELCREIRRFASDSYHYVIMLTAKGERNDLLSGMEAGADAFMIKPLDSAQLQAQIQVANRIIDLETQLARRIRDLTEAGRKIRNDLQAAAEIQRALLPRERLILPQVEFAWVFQSCDEVAGDMFNVFRLDEHLVGFYVLDVSGHGVQAALLSVSLSRALTPLPEHGGILKKAIEQAPFYEIATPPAVGAELNRRFPVMKESSQFFTMVYGLYNLDTREFNFIRAGHPGPIHLSGDKISRLEKNMGCPIGVMEHAEFEECRLTLLPGDQVILYTDGVEEAQNPERQQYGIERLEQCLSEHRQQGIEKNIQSVLKGVEEFSRGHRQNDDITMVGFQVR